MKKSVGKLWLVVNTIHVDVEVPYCCKSLNSLKMPMTITVIQNCAPIALPYKPLKSCAVVQTALPFCVKSLTFFALDQTALQFCLVVLFSLFVMAAVSAFMFTPVV